MGKYGHIFNKGRLRQVHDAPPPPDPDPVIRFNPNFVFNMAVSVRNSATQRNNIIADIADINTAAGFKPDISANWVWAEAEEGLNGWVWTIPDLLQSMAATIGCNWYVKLFTRTYDATHAVPDYMQSTAGTAYRGDALASPFNTGGTGTSSNGEYSDGSAFSAKFWVPDVADRFAAWLTAIAGRYNDDPSFGGIIINETATLNGAGTGMTPVNPENNADILKEYFQQFFQACIDTRPLFSKCEFAISPNNPNLVFTYSPISALDLFNDHKIANYYQDAYVYPPGKSSVKNILQKCYPFASATSSMHLLSGEVSTHKGVNGSETTSTSTISLTTGIKNIVVGTGKTIANNAVVTLVHDLNDPTNNYMTGTAASIDGGTTPAYNPSTGALRLNITSKVGTGSFSEWEVGIGTNYYPPHTIDQVVRFALEPAAATADLPAFPGGTHMHFQVNATRIPSPPLSPFNAQRYLNQVEYLKTTDVRPKQTRPTSYPS